MSHKHYGKKLLFLQHRPEDELSNNDLNVLISLGVPKNNIVSIRMEKGNLPLLNLHNYNAVIVGGGPSKISSSYNKKYEYQKVFEPWLFNYVSTIIKDDIPFLGLCYGIGLLTQSHGGVVSNKYAEGVEAASIFLTKEGKKDKLTKLLSDNFRSAVGHQEAAESLPKNAVLLATGQNCPIQMFRIKNNVYATQFHPELDIEGLRARVLAYKHLGYFKPEEANDLIEQASQYDISNSQVILKQFLKYYMFN
ncbi:MAG: hypothetical protein QG562_131 [Patescibacteria group bacterium]|nr:hypothetical protein [Patescibacteria group bacterium]